MPSALQVNLLHIRSARDVMQESVALVNVLDNLETLKQLACRNLSMRWFLVVDKGQVVGVIPHDYALPAQETDIEASPSVTSIMRHDFIFASENDKLTDIVARMHRPHASVGVILSREGRAASADAVVGIITWEHIAEVLEESVDLFTEYRSTP